MTTPKQTESRTTHRPLEPWLLIYDAHKAVVHPSQYEAQDAAAFCGREAGGNVDAIAMPVALALAAPDLAQACKMALPALETLMDELTGKRATDWGKVNDAACALRAALLKAGLA